MPETRPQNSPSVLPDLVKNYLEARIQNNGFDLPMLPEVAGQVMELCNSEETDAARLSQVLHRDQALAGHVLRVSNSPAIRPKTPIISLQQAVSRLGMHQIIEIALAVSVQAKVFKSDKHMDLVTELWRRAVAAGCFAKEVARHRRRNVESTFLCGLLHNVGKPVILDSLAGLEADTGMDLPTDHVLAALAHYHTEVGGQLAQEWQLPSQVTEAVRFHESYRDAPSFGEVAMTVNLATRLGRLALESDEGAREQELQKVQQLDVLEDLNIYPDDLEKLAGHAERVSQIVEATL